MDKPHVSREILTSHRSERGGRDIDHIVIHYTTSRNIEGSISHFVSGSPQVSAHYIVGQDGELVQMVPDADAAWHAGSSDMNRRSIGIEHVAKAGDKITAEQEATSAALIRWLAERYGIPSANIIPHAAVKATSCPGDLFAGYGGKAGADKATQTAALQRWLAARVFETAPAEQKEVAMTDAPMPTATPAPAAKPASASLTFWGAIISALSMAAPVLGSKWGLPVTPEIVTGIAGIVMTMIGRANAAPLTLR
jgi:hypothetical protein